jgi:hypothetical protein
MSPRPRGRGCISPSDQSGGSLRIHTWLFIARRGRPLRLCRHGLDRRRAQTWAALRHLGKVWHAWSTIAATRSARRRKPAEPGAVAKHLWGHATFSTIRPTMAQALTGYLAWQMTEIDGKKVPLIAGVWAIFGHGALQLLARRSIRSETSCRHIAPITNRRWRMPRSPLPRRASTAG